MASGLLPKNSSQSDSSAAGFFASLTVDNLIVNSTAAISNLIVSGSLTFAGIFKAAAGVWADTYSNYTPGSTVTLSTRGSNANVLLSPDGTGNVVVKAGSVLTADTVTSTTGATDLTLTATGANVQVASAKQLRATSPRFDQTVTVAGTSTATLTLTCGAAPAGTTLTYADSSGSTAVGFVQPTAARAANFPDADGIVVLDTATQTLTGKTMSTSNNTIRIGAFNLASLVNQPVTTGSGPTFGNILATGITNVTPNVALNIYSSGINNGINLVPAGTGKVQLTGGHALAANQLTSVSGPLSITPASGTVNFGAGVTLPTSGGPAATLDYYADVTTTHTWSGAFVTPQVAAARYVRVGKVVTFYSAGTVGALGTVSSLSSTAPPTGFAPTTTPALAVIAQTSAGNYQWGFLLWTGSIWQVWPGPNSLVGGVGFPNSGVGGFVSFTVTYQVA